MSLISSIEIGKHKAVACSHDTETLTATYTALATELDAMRRLLGSSRPASFAVRAEVRRRAFRAART